MIEGKEEIYHGVWFLPDSQVKIQGHLTVTDFVIELHLTDPTNQELSERITDSDIDELKYPVIHGRGRFGEKITLYDCSGFMESFNAKLMLYGDDHYKGSLINCQTFQIFILSIIRPSYFVNIVLAAFYQ